MPSHSNVVHAKIDGASSIHMCLLCRYREVTSEAGIDSSPTEQSESLWVGVCRHCQETYLSVGVALVNPQTQSVMVITEQAFKTIFDRPIPQQKIVYVEEEIIEKVYGLFLVSQETKAHVARARRAMVH